MSDASFASATQKAKTSPSGRQPRQSAAASRTAKAAGSSIIAAPARVPLPTAAAPKPALVTTTPPQRTLPQLTMNPVAAANMNIAISPATPIEGPKFSMTSKEWVIPPRPKPGRKPATDTPPTKRKAQNRAAQRAFRERRAARVGELEEQLDLQNEDFDKKEVDFKDSIRSLELDLQSFRSRCMLLENMLDRERQERIRTETEAEALRQRLKESHFRNGSMSSQRHADMSQHRSSFASNRLPKPRPSKDLSISNMITPADSSANDHLTCGGCSPSSRCACAEHVLSSISTDCVKCGFGNQCECLDEMAQNSMPTMELKRPSSPTHSQRVEKRQKQVISEVDFSTMFSRRSAAEDNRGNSSMPPSSMLVDIESIDPAAFKEGCGFCKDGTYCACADAAMATPAMTPPETIASSGPRQVETPPPSETDVTPTPLYMEMTADGAVKLPPRRKTAPAPKPAKVGGCGANGPGTCAQCQADPKSGLFCRLMSAKFSGDGSSGGCCGGKGAGGGCCKTKKQPAPVEEKITLPSLPSLGLTCAEAYQTLSSHRNFDKAADDIGSWLPKLKAAQRGQSRQTQKGRMAIEVEAASIMSVLKEFDIRFGREC